MNNSPGKTIGLIALVIIAIGLALFSISRYVISPQSKFSSVGVHDQPKPLGSVAPLPNRQ